MSAPKTEDQPKTQPKVAAGWKLWVKSDGKPGMKRVQTHSPPETEEIVHTRNIMRRQNSDGSGKYFTERKVAFEDATQKWLVLYETKPLKLMNSGEKYRSVWNSITESSSDDDLITEESKDPAEELKDPAEELKNALFVLEMSVPVHRHGRVVLESMCYTIQKNLRHGRFVIVPPKDETRLFETDSVATDGNLYPLLRQCSADRKRQTHEYRICCRPIAAPNIDMVFIVYPRTMVLDMPDILDKKTYRKLLHLEDVLLFRQNTQ